MKEVTIEISHFITEAGKVSSRVVYTANNVESSSRFSFHPANIERQLYSTFQKCIIWDFFLQMRDNYVEFRTSRRVVRFRVVVQLLRPTNWTT